MKIAINKINITNFRNYVSTELLVNGKNVLLYGGNGAGKSSLSKALNSFFLGNKVIENFFRNSNPILTHRRIDENGVYANNTSVILHLDNGENIKLNNDSFYTDKEMFIQTSEMKRDYSYKDVVEIFNTLSENPFHEYVIHNFSDALKIKISDIEEVTSTSYETIVELIKNYRHAMGSNYEKLNEVKRNKLRKYKEEFFYKKYESEKSTITLKKLLNLIELKDVIADVMDKRLKNIVKKIKQYLVDDYSKQFSEKFKKYISLMPISDQIQLEIEGEKYYYFQLYLKIKYNGIELKNPNGYLNEAKISEMAISIICALIKIAEEFNTVDFSPIIFDDLLVSLDMINREKLITIIVEYFSKNQIFFFTHDMSLFQLMNDNLKALGKDDEWVFYTLNNNCIEEHESYLFPLGC